MYIKKDNNLMSIQSLSITHTIHINLLAKELSYFSDGSSS